MIKAILTGHSRGLGAAIAADLLAHKIPTLGLSRRAHVGLGQDHPDLLTEVEIDLADDAALRRWLSGNALRDFLADSKTILLINNAGSVQPIGPLETQDAAMVAKTVSLNVTAPLMLAAAVAAMRGGAELRIVHVSSGAGRKAYAGWNIYCATKAALDHHARAVVEDGSKGVKICSLAPGIIDTDMQAELRASSPAKFPMHADFIALKAQGALLKPADVAANFVRYLLSEQFGQQAIADLREIKI